MGYDRDDVALTCGERDDREVMVEELAAFLRVALSEGRDADVIAGALLLAFDIFRA